MRNRLTLRQKRVRKSIKAAIAVFVVTLVLLPFVAALGYHLANL